MLEALLQAVRDTPQDDAPRLVLADWLDEHGDDKDGARAEFIRLQCQLARMEAWDEGSLEARLRAGRLFAEHRHEWSVPPRASAEERQRWTFSLLDFDRGFPSCLHLRDRTPEDEVRKWLTQLPITRADFQCGWSAGRRFLGLAEWAGLRELKVTLPHVWDTSGDAAGTLADLLAAPPLRTLRSLAMSAGFDDGQATALAAVDLPHLRSLRLGRRLTPAGVAALAGADWFGDLTALDIAGNGRVGDTALEQMLHSGAPPAALRSLTVSDCKLTGRSWTMLAARGPASLVQLDAGANSDGAGALSALGQGRYRLESLRLYGCGTQPATAARLFHGLALGRLRRLGWGGASAGDDGVAALAASPLPGTLRSLSLSYMRGFTDVAVRHLCDGLPWPHLAHLDLVGNPLSSDAALALVEHPNFARLVSLGVTVGERGHVFVKKLARSPAAARLRSLTLAFPLSPGAIDALADSPHLSDLDELAVQVKNDLWARRLQDRFGPRLGGAASHF